MRDLINGLMLCGGIYLAANFLKLAWILATASEQQKREWREGYARKQYDRRMIRFWLSGGKVKH